MISIITICLNRVSDIAQTCESIVNQTWSGFEWIVIDGGSTDGTAEILEKYRARCAALVSERDSGIYNAMNKGLALAKGEYVLFLNGGDRLNADDVLEKIFAAGRHSADIVYGDIFLERDDAIVGRETSVSAGDVDFLFFASGRTIPHSGAFARRELFLKYGFFDESYRIIGDLERWVVFAKNGCSFSKIDEAVSVFKLGGISDDKAPTNKIRLAEFDRLLNTYYTAGEVAEARRRRRISEGGYAATRAFLPLWAGAALFSRMESVRGVKKVKWCVLGLPLLKMRAPVSGKCEYRLFGFIPLPS